MAAAPTSPGGGGTDPEAGIFHLSAVMPVANAIAPEVQKRITDTLSLSGLAGVVSAVLPEGTFPTNWYTNLAGAAASTVGALIAKCVVRYLDPEKEYVSDWVAETAASAATGGLVVGGLAGSPTAGLVFAGLAGVRVAATTAIEALGTSPDTESGPGAGYVPIGDGIEDYENLPSVRTAGVTVIGSVLGGLGSGFAKALMGESGAAVQTGILVALFFTGLKTMMTSPHLKTTVGKFLNGGFGAMGIVNPVVEVVGPAYSKAALTGADRGFPGVVGAALVANMATVKILKDAFGWETETAGRVASLIEAIMVSTVGTAILAAVAGTSVEKNFATTVPFAVGILVKEVPELFLAAAQACSPNPAAPKETAPSGGEHEDTQAVFAGKATEVRAAEAVPEKPASSSGEHQATQAVFARKATEATEGGAAAVADSTGFLPAPGEDAV